MALCVLYDPQELGTLRNVEIPSSGTSLSGLRNVCWTLMDGCVVDGVTPLGAWMLVQVLGGCVSLTLLSMCLAGLAHLRKLA